MAIELEMTDAGMMTEEELLETSAEVAEEVAAEAASENAGQVEPEEDEDDGEEGPDELIIGDGLDDTETVEDSAAASASTSTTTTEEWPDEVVTTTDAAPRSALDDLLDQITNAHLAVTKAKTIVFDCELSVKCAKNQLKSAEDGYSAAVDNMLELTAKLNADQKRPLFPIDKEVAVISPREEAADVSPDAGDQALPPEPDATLPPVDPSTLWRANSIDVLGLPPKMAEKLRCGDIATLGELADLIQRCEHGNHWPKGIGKDKGGKIVDALVAWQKENLETASQDVSVTIPAWDSLSVEEQGSYIESRARRLEGKTNLELHDQFAGSANQATHTIFDEGAEAESLEDQIVNCPYSPTPDGDWSQVDAWVAGWTYNNRRLDSNDAVCETEG